MNTFPGLVHTARHIMKAVCTRRNTFPGLVHTARHIMKAVCTRSRRPNPRGGESPKVWVVIGMKS